MCPLGKKKEKVNSRYVFLQDNNWDFLHFKHMYLNVMFLNLFIQMLIVRRSFLDISSSSYIKWGLGKGNTGVGYPVYVDIFPGQG